MHLQGKRIWYFASQFRLFATHALLCTRIHSLLCTKSTRSYTPLGFNDNEVNGVIIQGSWREHAAPNAVSLENDRSGRPNLIAKRMGQIFRDLSQ